MTKNGYTLEESFDGEEEIFDISDRILALSDELSEDIIIENIEDHINNKIPFIERVNYVELFKNKLTALSTEDRMNPNVKLEIERISSKIIDLVREGLIKNYCVNLGSDLEDVFSVDQYLDKLETLYEFFFIRNYSNLFDYLYSNIIKKKSEFALKYKEKYQESEESDLFVTQNKKKFKNFEDAIVINYITDIIYDIQSISASGVELYKEIINLDLYELYNNKMDNLIVNYGNDLIITNDSAAAGAYFKILDSKEIFTDMRNDIVLKYLEGVELENEKPNEK